ncbi:hypothetical protein D3C79_542530 [compost metagenome]
MHQQPFALVDRVVIQLAHYALGISDGRTNIKHFAPGKGHGEHFVRLGQRDLVEEAEVVSVIGVQVASAQQEGNQLIALEDGAK